MFLLIHLNHLNAVCTSIIPIFSNTDIKVPRKMFVFIRKSVTTIFDYILIVLLIDLNEN